MPDKWGRPTFQDGAALAQGIMAVDDRLQEQEQRKIQEQTQKAKSFFLNNKNLIDKDVSGVDDLSGFNEKAVNDARIKAASDLSQLASMDVKVLQRDKAEAEQQATQAKKHAGKALMYAEQGNKKGFFDEFTKGYSQYQDGQQAEVIETSDGEMSVVFEDPLGEKSEPMSYQEAVEFVKTNPIDPAQFLVQKKQTEATIRDFNTEALLNAEKEINEQTGETRWKVKLKRKNEKPFIVYYNKEPGAPGSKIVDMKGENIDDQWKTAEQMDAILERQEKKAGIGKTKAQTEKETALAGKYRAEAENERKGGGQKPDMTESEAIKRRSTIRKAMAQLGSADKVTQLMVAANPELKDYLGQDMDADLKEKALDAYEQEIRFLEENYISEEEGALGRSRREEKDQNTNDPLGLFE